MENWKKALIAGSATGSAIMFLKKKPGAGIFAGGRQPGDCRFRISGAIHLSPARSAGLFWTGHEVGRICFTGWGARC